jgi:putative transposase
LRWIDIRAWRQNIGTKGLAGKIFQGKELADVEIAGLLLDAVKAPRTFPIMGRLYPRSRLLVTRTGNFSVEGCGKGYILRSTFPIWNPPLHGITIIVAQQSNAALRWNWPRRMLESNLSHTYISDLAHCVFSTRLRRNLIAPEIQSELWAFLGGIARKNGFKALMVGGTENHVNILLSLPATMPVAKALRLVKGASSRWMNERHSHDFGWQEGYGAFTIGISQKNHTMEYIRTQAAHHRKRNFEEEFLGFLKKHGVEYDRQYVWG